MSDWVVFSPSNVFQEEVIHLVFPASANLLRIFLLGPFKVVRRSVALSETYMCVHFFLYTRTTSTDTEVLFLH